MNITQTGEATPQKPLRLWPGVVAAVLVCVVRFVMPIVVPDTFIFGLIGALVCTLVIVVWWLFFSRAAWSERLGAIALMIVALILTRPLLHESIATAGMGRLFFVLAIPVLSLGLVAGAVASRHLSPGLRRASLVATILFACGVFTLLRTGGISGEGTVDLRWRWSQTPEQRLLAQAKDEPLAVSPAPAATVAETPKDQVVTPTAKDTAALP